MGDKVNNKVFEGLAERIIAHAEKKSKRGKRGKMASVHFLGEKNPREALRLARQVVRNGKDSSSQLLAKAHEETGGIDWNFLNNTVFIGLVKLICQTSNDEKQIRQRMKKELKYTHSFYLLLATPSTLEGKKIREEFRLVGGVVTKSGAMAKCQILGHDGQVLSF